MVSKSIMQYWEGSAGPDIACLMNKWRDLNQDYSYHRFNRETAAIYLYENYGENSPVLNSFLASGIPAMASDIFRVAWIYDNGGIYVDAASNPLLPIREWKIFLDSEIALMRKWHGKIWNGFIHAPRKSPIIKEILNKICDNVKKRKSNDVWVTTGPGNFLFLGKSDLSDLRIIDQKILSTYFKLVNNLPHKKSDNHWSHLQKNQTIYRIIDEQPKVLVHLGPHKTGTTSLQILLESNEELLSSKGIGLLTVRSSKSNIYKHFRNSYTRALHRYLLSTKSSYADFVAIDKMIRALRGMILLANDNYSQVIISDENLLGPQVGHYYAGKQLARDPYPAAFIVLSSLISAFGDRLDAIYLIRREFSSWLLSVYKDYMVKGKDPVYPGNWRSRLSKDLASQYDSLFTLAKLFLHDRLVEINFDKFTCSIASGSLRKIFGTQVSEVELFKSTSRPAHANKSKSLKELHGLCFNYESSMNLEGGTSDNSQANQMALDDANIKKVSTELNLFIEEVEEYLSKN